MQPGFMDAHVVTVKRPTRLTHAASELNTLSGGNALYYAKPGAELILGGERLQNIEKQVDRLEGSWFTTHSKSQPAYNTFTA